MDKATILRRAAEIIRERGWTRGMYEKYETGEVCVSGAIMAAVGLNPRPRPTVCALEAYGYFEAVDHFEGTLDPIDAAAHWNDYTATSADDVIAALEAAAEAD